MRIFEKKVHNLKFVLLLSLLTLLLLPTSASATRIAFSHDGSFDDYIALAALAAKSKEPGSKVTLIGVATDSIGESYCLNSNGYPFLKQPNLANPKLYDSTNGPDFNPTPMAPFTAAQGSIDGITEKVLSASNYPAKIYSGCGDVTPGSVRVTNDLGNPPPPGLTPAELEAYLANDIPVELPLAGMDQLGPCLYHWQWQVINPDIYCWSEFPRNFRDESFNFVLPAVQNVINKPFADLGDTNLIQSKKASRFLAETMCSEYVKPNKRDPLVILSVGPTTNLARAYKNISAKPKDYGCPNNGIKLSDLKNVVTTYFMGGVFDFDEANNFIDRDNNPNTPKEYRLNELDPVWAPGNVYFQDGNYTFGSQHIPAGAYPTVLPGECDFPELTLFPCALNQHHEELDSTSAMELNFGVDPEAVSVALKAPIPSKIVPLNAVNNSKIGSPDGGTTPGLAGLVEQFDSPGQKCYNASADLVRSIIRSHQFGVYNDALNFWDTTTAFAVWDSTKDPSRVEFTSKPGLEVTYGTSGGNGDPATVTPGLRAEDVYRQDGGKLFQRANTTVDNPNIKIAAEPGIDPNPEHDTDIGNSPVATKQKLHATRAEFTKAFHQEFLNLLCP